MTTDKCVRVPRRALFSDDVYAAEIGPIFRSSWLFIGHESEVPDAGDLRMFLAAKRRRVTVIHRTPL